MPDTITIFDCSKCGHQYSVKKRAITEKCPRCKKANKNPVGLMAVQFDAKGYWVKKEL